MRLVFLCGRVPYPPMNGGMRDTYNRLCAFVDMGFEVLVIAVSNSDEPPPSAVLTQEFEQRVGKLVMISSSRSFFAKLAKLLTLHAEPLMSIRSSREDLIEVEKACDRFRPEAIWLDYLFMAPLMRVLSSRYNIPVYYRSHNIQYKYYKIVARLPASPTERIRAMLRAGNVYSYEKRVMEKADKVYDISADDLEVWKAAEGVQHIEWLPPVFNFATEVETSAAYDLAYLGALWVDLNLEGLDWFFKFVLPRIRASGASPSILIGGSNPSKTTAAKLRREPGVTLIENPEMASSIFSAAKVLINPVLAGSGVNVKTIEMLGYDRTLVTTRAGIRGLPDSVRRHFLVADTPSEFAHHVLDALSRSSKPSHADARELFGFKAFKTRIGNDFGSDVRAPTLGSVF